MKIVNSTCYNTEDLEVLCAKAHEAYDCDILLHSKWRPILTPPEEIVIGYTNNVGNLGYYSQVKTYVTKRKQPLPRIGIIKRSKLPISNPLVMLAKVGNGEEILVPTNVVRQIAWAFLSVSGGYAIGSLMSNGDELKENKSFVWLTDFQLRYNERAARGSKKEVDKARSRAKLRRQELRLTNCKDEVLQHLRSLKILNCEIKQLKKSITGAVETNEEKKQV